MRIFSKQGFRLFDSSINIHLESIFELSYDITILKIAIFDKVDYIEIQPVGLLMHNDYGECS